jgi:TetR/AcrR family transcriptional regulator, transcriptional repressor for nem operon
MARYSQKHKATTREIIVKIAAGMIRTNGLDNTGVASVMNAAGLTHGGFYAHFPAKEQLLTAAMTEAMSPSKTRLSMLVEMAKQAGDAALVPAHYLSTARAADVANGCAAAALSSELHRAPLSVRTAFAHEAMASADVLGGLDENTENNGWAHYAMMIGALSLIRALPDQDVQNAIRADVEHAFSLLEKNS